MSDQTSAEEAMSVTRHRFTVEEYHKMGEAGIFSEDDRVELIDGEVVEMTPIGWRHARCVRQLINILAAFAGGPTGRYQVDAQNPILLGEHGEPEPDLVLLSREPPAGRLPGPDEVALIVEVADTSLAHDRETKLPLYAAAGIPEAWVVDLAGDRIEAYSRPGAEGYGTVTRYERGQRVVAATIDGLVFDAAEALPPEG